MRQAKDMSIIVTGGGSGIGAGIAILMAQLGAHVTICGRREEKIKSVAESIGPACAWIQADVDNPVDRQKIIDAAVTHGGGIDAVVHSAGNIYRGPLAHLEESKLNELFQTNVVSAMMFSQLALPHLLKRQGCIIFFGSAHIQRAFPQASPYAATKAALETLTATLAAELGPQGVRVSCVRPGSVLTEINQRAGVFDAETARKRSEEMVNQQALHELGTVEDVAEAVAYLVQAGWSTGTVVTIDGGLGLGIIKS